MLYFLLCPFHANLFPTSRPSCVLSLLLKYPSTSSLYSRFFLILQSQLLTSQTWFFKSESLSSNLLSCYPFISLKALTTICNLICFLAHWHISPLPKWKVAGEWAILSSLILHWWIIRAEKNMTHGKYSIFICWVTKYINHSNKWCSKIFLREVFFPSWN